MATRAGSTVSGWITRETGATGGVTITPVFCERYGEYATEFHQYWLEHRKQWRGDVTGLYTYNTLSGVRIENRARGTGTGGVTLNNINSYQNDNEGVYIRTNGNTALSNMECVRKLGGLKNGIDIQVDGNGTVTLTNIHSLLTTATMKCMVVSHRQITAKNLSATDYSRGGYGQRGGL